ncbi:hypothetical protein BGZ54_006181 [Gamsiella multidivaricata]|nr:hypothetical protein BGZ54_006181 [Gamsiella multidivaricata]
MSTVSASNHEGRQVIDNLMGIADTLDLTPQGKLALRGKLDGLIGVLHSYRNETNGFCGVVLVEREVTACVLKEFLAQFGQKFGLDFMRPSLLAGRRIRKADAEANGEFVMEAAHFTLVVRFNLKDNDLDAYVRSRSRTRDQTKDIVVLRSCSNISHPKPHVGLQLAPAGSGAVGTAFLKLLVSLDLFVRDLTKDQHVLTQDKDKKLANKALLVKSNHVQTAKTALGQAYLEGFLEDTLMEVGHLVNPFQSISSWEDFAVLYDSVKTRVPGHSLSPGIRWFEDLQAVEYAIG